MGIPGGCFAGLTMNTERGLPDQPKDMLHKWGAIVYDREKAANGDKIMIDISLGNDDSGCVHLETIFWDRATYEKAFLDAGFTSVEWVAVVPHPAASEQEIDEFKDYFAAHKSVGFRAKF